MAVGGERWLAIITLDIRYAFNTASWNLIKEELRTREIPAYLQMVIDSYLSNREFANN